MMATMSAGIRSIDFTTLRAKALPWVSSLLAVIALVTLMVSMKGRVLDGQQTVTVRSVDVAVPPPPEPPPPIKTRRPETTTDTPSIDVVGPGEGPTLDYSDNPKLAMLNLEKVERPDFDVDSLDLGKAISVDFPLLEVKELDRIPRLVSTNHVRFPRELRSRGIKEVTTTVEIIIDRNGRAFVKKIVDPVYPMMPDVIRKSINNSRFTIPKKDGKPVQAVYLYNLKFIDLNF